MLGLQACSAENLPWALQPLTCLRLRQRVIQKGISNRSYASLYNQGLFLAHAPIIDMCPCDQPSESPMTFVAIGHRCIGTQHPELFATASWTIVNQNQCSARYAGNHLVPHERGGALSAMCLLPSYVGGVEDLHTWARPFIRR
jgi:hypothetical protein